MGEILYNSWHCTYLPSSVCTLVTAMVGVVSIHHTHTPLIMGVRRRLKVGKAMLSQVQTKTVEETMSKQKKLMHNVGPSSVNSRALEVEPQTLFCKVQNHSGIILQLSLSEFSPILFLVLGIT